MRLKGKVRVKMNDETGRILKKNSSNHGINIDRTSSGEKMLYCVRFFSLKSAHTFSPFRHRLIPLYKDKHFNFDNLLGTKLSKLKDLDIAKIRVVKKKQENACISIRANFLHCLFNSFQRCLSHI